MRFIKKISKVGTNSLMIIIDKVITDTMKLESGDKIVIDIVKKLKKKVDK